VTEKNKLLDLLQYDHSIRLNLMSQANKVKQKADDEVLISEELEEEINYLHKYFKAYVEAHEEGLTYLEGKV